MKFNIRLLFILFISSFLTGISQNNINWISWDTMIKQRASDSVKKRYLLIYILIGVDGVREWMQLHLVTL